METEFAQDTSSAEVIESLIAFDNKLQQKEAAVGLLTYAQQHSVYMHVCVHVIMCVRMLKMCVCVQMLYVCMRAGRNITGSLRMRSSTRYVFA